MSHAPVMLDEVLSALSPKVGEVYVDGTFGAGGYTRAILNAAPCTVVAIDRDEAVLSFAEKMSGEYGDRFIFLRGAFGDVETLLRGAGIGKVDGFVLDIGVSSMQLDQAGRGFSFRADAPLDMRMDRECGKTAADVVNNTDEDDLANLIYKYGDERYSRRIAKKIVSVRNGAPIQTTGELAEIVRGCIPGYSKVDPATKTFQALRIAVNDELGQLASALASASNILKGAGRLVVVSFHSLEDKIVKNYLLEQSGQTPRGSRFAPDVSQGAETVFKIPSKKSIKPSDAEITSNPRARSARLRSAVRL